MHRICLQTSSNNNMTDEVQRETTILHTAFPRARKSGVRRAPGNAIGNNLTALSPPIPHRSSLERESHASSTRER